MDFLRKATFTSLLALASCVNGSALDVYILTGQSNSLGTTNLEGDGYGPGTDPADDSVEFYWSNVDATNTVYPPLLYGDSGGLITDLQMQQGGGSNPAFWGPEFGLARSLFANNGSQDVLIIKASRGGGGNTYWDKNAFEANANSGHMWGHLRDTVDLALDAVMTRDDTFSLKGLLYLQGESNNGSEAAVADTRLNKLIVNLKSHVEGQHPNTTGAMLTAVGEIAASQSNANRILTTERQMVLAAGDESIAFVDTRDLPLKSDNIHFGRDEKLAIGSRFGVALLDMIDPPNDVAGDVNQDGMLTGNGTGLPEEDDISAFIAAWQSETSLLSSINKIRNGDLDLSGKTDLADAFVLHQALAAEGGSFPFDRLVPEPSAMGLTIWAMGIVLVRKRSHVASRRA